MSNQATSRKSLWMALLAAVVVLTMVLCLAGCNNEQAEGETTAPTATVSGETEQLDLYWNMDRALYDGKSEAGMSSREPGEDGYFHVRFFKDGEIVELRVADRKTVNAMEVQDLMGLEFDEDGIVIGIIPVDDLPIEKLAWQFYVQSAGGKLIKANSSATLNGMEVLLETNENTGVWDMTGLSGDVGCEADPMQLDRIMALGDADGNVLHVFIYERPNYMKTHEGECEHCQKTVTWYEWTKESALPLTTGHYQLMVDVSGVGQHSMPEDCKLCVDLNGHRVDGKSGARIYSLHNAGTELAIMDTSEAKTGRIAAHGKGDQGMCVWLRYGVFYLYDGILDGSDATTHLNGPTVNMASNTYFYMYGGELIGGTADVVSNGKGGWTGGVGGTLFIGANSKFVMNDGIIHGGRAKAAVTKYTADGKPNGYSCGVGGNIYANTGAVIELNGGVIRDGVAEAHTGNLYLGGKVELTINETLISNGKALGRTTNGGNLFVSSSASVVMNGGTIRNGRVYNCGGNVYINGRFQMNDGIITDGKVVNWDTKKVNDGSSNRNVFSVQGDFYMYGGRIAGGFQAIDSANDTNYTIVLVSARSVIFDEDGTGPHLTLSDTAGGTKCIMYVGPMHDEGKVGISGVQQAVFTKPTKVENTDNFISDIPGADIGWCEQGLIIGKVHCLCSQDPEIGDDEHKLGCDKIQYAWAPWTSATSLPTSEGYWYLTKNVTTTGNTVRTNGDDHLHVALDLNGKTVQANSGRMYSLFENSSTYLEDGKTIAPNIEGEAIELTLTDTLGGGTVNMGSRADADQGQLIWGRWNDSVINILAGTYNCSAVNSKRWNGVVIDAAGELNIYGGTISGGNGTGTGGMISANKFNLYGGVIENGTATWGGGNVQVKGGGVMNMYGGTIRGGSVNVKTINTADSGYGGNIHVNGTFNMYDGIIEDGEVGPGRKDGTATGVSAGGGCSGNIHVAGTAYLYGGTIQNGKSDTGGNIGTNNGGSYIYLDGVQVLDGEAVNGGNIAINVRSNKLLEIKGDTLVSGGKATSNGGNLYANIWVSNGAHTKIDLLGGTITKGTAKTYGGNIYLTSGCAENVVLTMENADVTDGYGALKGSNVYLNTSKAHMYLKSGNILNGDSSDCGANINVQSGKLFMSGGLVKGGTKNGAGTSISNVYSVNGTVELTGGEIAGDFGNTNTAANGCVLKVGGTAKVTEGLGGNGTGLGVHPGDAAFARPSIEVMDGFSGNILMSASGYVSTPCDAKYVSNFSTLIPDTGISHQDGKIFVGKTMCVCGGKAVGVGDHTCKNVVWTPWTSTTQLPKTTGNYYLVFDVSNSSSTTFDQAGEINIDLNGHKYTVTNGDRAFRVRKGDGGNYKVTIGLTDSKSSGKVIVTHSNAQDGAVIWTTAKDHTINLYAGVLDASGVTTAQNKDSSAIKLGGGVFNMYGGEIKGGKSPAWDGGTAFIASGTTFNLYKGTVSGGQTGGHGGNFLVVGTLNVKGGTITEGSAIGGSRKGGNIYIRSGGVVNVSGGTISNGHTDDCGGNIHVVSGGKLFVSGGTITGGYKVVSGGKEYNSISNVYSVNGYVDISGGKIDGGICATNTVANGCTTKISGNPVIGKNSAGYGLDLGRYDPNNVGFARPDLQIGTMTSGASVAMTATGYISTATASGNEKYFYNASTNEPAVYDSGKVAIGKLACICGSTTSTHVGDCDGTKHMWQPVTSLPTTTGYYYLTKDITTGQVNMTNKTAQQVYLDLNGKTVTSSYRAYLLQHDNLLGITDHVGGGTIKVKGASGDICGAILIQYSAKFKLYSGTITEASNYVTNMTEGGLVHMSSTSSFDMYGGTLQGGNAASGGAVFIKDSATMTMHGGTITGGEVAGHGGNFQVFGTLNVKGGTITGGYSERGGNINVMNGGTVRVSGGSVTNGVVTNCGGNINLQPSGKLYISGGTISGGYRLSGSEKIYNSVANVYSIDGYVEVTGGRIEGLSSCNTVANGCTLKISGNPVISKNSGGYGLQMWNNNSSATYSKPVIELGKLTSGASIAINSTGVVTSNTVTADQAAYFHPVAEGNTATVVDNAANYGVAAGDVGKLYIGHVHCICGGSIPSGTKLADGTTHTCQNVAFQAASSIGHITGNRNVYLTKDVTLGYQIQMKGGYTYNLCLNGHTVTGATNTRMFRSITVASTGEAPTADSTFNITTCDDGYTDGQTNGNVLKPVGYGWVDGGAFLMGKGKVQLFRGTIDASGYTTVGEKDTGAGKHGGAVALTGGHFVQYPGTTIIGGWAGKNLTDTKNAASHGGAVYIGNGSSVYTMLGGTIKDGFCHQLGGNVYVYSGTFNMYDGVIENGRKKNSSTGDIDMYALDGNVTLRGGAKFNMMGGTIYGKVNGFLEACNGMTISGSAKVVWNDTDTGIVANNIGCSKIVTNLGKLSSDARIGFCIPWDPAGSEVKVANVTDPANFSMNNVGLHMNFSGKGDRTFALKLVGNELIAYETTPATP